MAIRIQCSGCGKAYSLQDAMAGRRVKCPACGATMEVPAAGLPGDVLFAEPLAAAGPGANAALHIKLIGIFDIIAGGLSILWGLLMIFGIIGVLTGAMEEDPDAPPAAVMIGLYIGMLVLSIGAGIVEILAGVQVLKRRPRVAQTRSRRRHRLLRQRLGLLHLAAYPGRRHLFARRPQ